MTSTQTPIVRMQKLHKHFGSLHVLKDIDLEIVPGEVVVVIGASGSGKSTLIRCINGLEEFQSGSLDVDGNTLLPNGKSSQALQTIRTEVGMVFQQFNLFPHLSVLDNVTLAPMKVRGWSRQDAEETAKRLLDRVGIADQANKYPSQLSGGQQQRVALARALVFEPQLVLMDEPLGALDKQLREHMQMEIKHLHQRLGVTVVYVTHDQGEALTMSDRVAVFHQGEIQQIAPPRELYETPQNTFVAQFIGENNRLAGQLVSRDGEQCVVRLARGEQVKATAVNVGAVGEPVSLSIRPERIRLNGHSEACPNRFSGRIAEFIYLGDHVRIRMEVCGQSDFYVKQPVAELDPGLEVGDLVPLGWSVEHVRALDPLLAE